MLSLSSFLLFLVCCDGREDSPGHRECDSSIQQIGRYIHDLDQASLSAAGQGGLRGNFPGSLQSYQEQVLNSARQLLDHIDPIRTAAKGEGDNLPHLVRVCAVMFVVVISITLLGMEDSQKMTENVYHPY